MDCVDCNEEIELAGHTGCLCGLEPSLENPAMIHFTCDLCGKELQRGDQDRHVVKIEAYTAHDPGELTEADLDDDHLEEISQILADEEDNPQDLPAATQHFRYDLCTDCHRRFVRDPLGKKQQISLFSSEN